MFEDFLRALRAAATGGGSVGTETRTAPSATPSPATASRAASSPVPDWAPTATPAKSAFDEWQEASRLFQASEQPVPPSVRESQRGEASSYFAQKALDERQRAGEVHSIGPVGDDYVRQNMGIRPAPYRGPVDQIQGLIDQAFQSRNRVPGDAGISPELTGIGAQDNPAATKEMDWEDFSQLGRRQKALVDLNSLLADASAADLALGDASVPKEARETYDTLAEELGFDGNRGSKRYAPNTLALIEQLGLNTGTRDLDEFLDLSVGATRDELETIRGGDRKWTRRLLSEDGPTPDRQSRLRASEQRRWAEESGEAIKEAMTKTLEKGNEILADFRTTMAADRSRIVKALGGEPGEVDRPLGYGDSKIEQDMRTAYDMFQDPAMAGERQNIFATMNSEWDTDQLNAFFSYADRRSRNEGRFGMPALAGREDMERIPVKELRDILGLSQSR